MTNDKRTVEDVFGYCDCCGKDCQSDGKSCLECGSADIKIISKSKLRAQETYKKLLNIPCDAKSKSALILKEFEHYEEALTAERRRAEAAEETVKLRYKELEESIYENKILQSRLQESNKFCEIFKKSQIEFEKRIEDLECRLDIALKSAEQWKKEALRLNNVEPPSITVPNDNLTREMRFNLCLKMIDQMNQIELDNLIRELNKK